MSEIADLIVRISADMSNFTAGMQQVGSNVTKAGKGITTAGKTLTMGVTAPILAMGAGIVKTSMDFNAGMSKVQATSGATGKEMVALKQKARDMGATTKFSATESAEAMNFMAMAGWDNSQMMDGLSGVMDLAAASGEGLGSVSDIVTDSLTAFGMEAKDSGKFADLLAAASSGANTTVGQLGESFKYAAPVAGALGFSARDTSLALGLMANAGIKASQSGTSMRTIMTNLVKPTKGSAQAMKKLGISVTDGSGKMKSFDTIMKDLRQSFKKLTPEQKAATAAQIAGKTGMSGLLAVVNASPKSFDKLGKSLDNSKGKAAEMAKIMQDNLKGQMEKLGSAIQEIALQFGEVLMPILRKVISVGIMPLVWAFGQIPQPMKAIIIVVAAFLASLGPILLVLGTMVTVIGGVITGLSAISGVIATIGLPVIAAVAGIIVAFALWAGWIVLIVAKLGIFKDALATIKAIMSGDFQTMFDLLHKNFGLSAGEAEHLAKAFKEMSDKAKIVAQVIKDNLGLAMEVLGDVIGELVDGGMNDLNEGTQESKNLFADMVRNFIKWGSKLINYLYDLFDTFGLIPIELKFANNKIVGEYGRLEAETNSHFNSLMSMQFLFGEGMSKANKKAYDLKFIDTKNAMAAELALVKGQIKKQEKVQMDSLKSLFKNTKIYTEKEEKAKLKSTTEHFNQSAQELENNNKKVLKITEKAAKEKRHLTDVELEKIDQLRFKSAEKEIGFITRNEAEQRLVYELSNNLTRDLDKAAAMETVVRANTTHKKIVEESIKARDKTIAAVIYGRDIIGNIDAEAAKKLIASAKDVSKKQVNDSLYTKNQTVDNANGASGGVLSSLELLAEELPAKTEKIKLVMLEVWKVLKSILPPILDELFDMIMDTIIDNAPKIYTAGVTVGAKLVSGVIAGIVSKIPALVLQLGIIVTKLLGFRNDAQDAINATVKLRNSLKPQALPWNKNTSVQPYTFQTRANGGISSGMTLVGERGAELVNLPKGSQVYNNTKTKNMLSDSSSNGSNGSLGSQNSLAINLSGVITVDTGKGLETLNSKAIEKIVANSLINNMSRYAR